MPEQCQPDSRSSGPIETRQIALSEAGIRSSKRSESQRLCVYVKWNDRTTTFDILERAAASDPDSRPKGIKRSHDAMILLAGFGLCIATFAALMGYWRYAAAVAATIFAAMVVLRRLRKNILWSGNARFSVMEMLILTAMAVGRMLD